MPTALSADLSPWLLVLAIIAGAGFTQGQSCGRVWRESWRKRLILWESDRASDSEVSPKEAEKNRSSNLNTVPNTRGLPRQKGAVDIGAYER